jgi:membrane protein implicated in regulation of membrane protease activity
MSLNYWVAFWVVVALGLLGLEAMSMALVGAYFAFGGLAAAIAASFDAALWIQVVVFAVVSVLGLALTRRPLKAALRSVPLVPSNAPAIVGRRGVITIAIPAGTGARGQVRIGTEQWSARPADENRGIDVGTTVEVVALEGVTALVQPLEALSAETESA